MIRALILRWLGAPTRADIRAMILREIDADRATEQAVSQGRASFIDIIGFRQAFERDRESRIANLEREDTRD
ncbi:hypothetical protein WG907_04530 [Sphingobium sp. AN558]|uniref:hypothetical protein n=1 Tax=Sphingobium sp. AN558 TaxID=3133442 RepID=UPI0030C17732